MELHKKNNAWNHQETRSRVYELLMMIILECKKLPIGTAEFLRRPLILHTGLVARQTENQLCPHQCKDIKLELQPK